MPTQAHITKAIESLDRMAQIVRNEMLIRGTYVDSEINEAKKAAGAICGGHKVCAIGSLWVGYGVKYEKRGKYVVGLPGVSDTKTWDYRKDDYGPSARNIFVKSRPALKLALNALNESADAYIKRHKLELMDASEFEDAIEALFEGTRHYEDDDSDDEDTKVARKQLLSVIKSAKGRLAKQLA
jgi:hypothetical protein